nr:unnamed protein product [Callosobruchus chinensis]
MAPSRLIYVQVYLAYLADLYLKSEKLQIIIKITITKVYKGREKCGGQLKLRNTSTSIVLPCAEEEARIWKLSRRREDRNPGLL